jgi:hypothetical protein
MIAAMATGSVDLYQPGKYPIVLSDALLGKTSKEVYTGLRCIQAPLRLRIRLTISQDNHKPDASAESSPSSVNLKPADSDASSYDLSLKDKSDKYSYNGVRTSGDGQYVLIFDPVKQHFVLHRVDSTFDMNLVSAPWTQDASALRSQHHQLEPEGKPQPPTLQRKASKGKKAAVAKTEVPRRKAEKPKKAKPPVREPTPEEEDSDDGLTIEYPDAAPPQHHYNPTPVFQRAVSEEVSDEDEDAEHESYEEEEHNQDVDHLKLPSPANNAGGLSDEDLELDLEKELEAEFEEAFNKADADESDESEEE